jgi:hypothetical protein
LAFRCVNIYDFSDKMWSWLEYQEEILAARLRLNRLGKAAICP